MSKSNVVGLSGQAESKNPLTELTEYFRASGWSAISGAQLSIKALFDQLVKHQI